MSAANYIHEQWTTDDGLPDGGEAQGVGFHIDWQRGPLVAHGSTQAPNGAFVETLIDVLIDRMRYYQSTRFACRENACALTHLEEAKHWLGARQDRRSHAAIAGTHETMDGERGSTG